MGLLRCCWWDGITRCWSSILTRRSKSFKILISNRWHPCCSGLDIHCWIMAVRQRHDERQLFRFRIIFITVRFLSLCRVEMTSAADVMMLCMTLEMTSLCIIHRHLASVTIANAIITLVVSLHCGIDFSKQTPLAFSSANPNKCFCKDYVLCISWTL